MGVVEADGQAPAWRTSPLRATGAVAGLDCSVLRLKGADTDRYMEMRAGAELTGRRSGRTDGNWNETGIMVAAGSGPKTTMPTHNDVNDDLRSGGSAVD